MIISDCYIIKRHVSHAWYGCWTIKALVEAKVLYDGFTMSCGGIAALLIIARPLQCLYYKTRKKPISQGKNVLLILVVHVPHLWLSKRAIIEQLAKDICWEKLP